MSLLKHPPSLPVNHAPNQFLILSGKMIVQRMMVFYENRKNFLNLIFPGGSFHRKKISWR
jgi:hypothetical protein